jgi:hypothetical protein
MGAASCTEKCSWSPSCDRDGGVYLDLVTVSWWKAMKKCRKNVMKVWLKFEKWKMVGKMKNWKLTIAIFG